MPKPRPNNPGQVLLPSTASTVQIYATIRQTLLSFQANDLARLDDYLGAQPSVYVRAQPSGATRFPYITLLLSRTSQASYNGYRETAQLEVQCIGKPESQLPAVESAMDIVDQCLTALTQSQAGLVVGRSRTRQTMPVFTDPADASTVAVVATYELFLWPSVLTSRAVSV